MPQYLGLPFQPIAEPELNPHLHLKRVSKVGVENPYFECVNCGDVGTLSELDNRECSHVQPPCPHCGCAPLCAEDCPGIREILGNDSNYVAGLDLSGTFKSN